MKRTFATSKKVQLDIYSECKYTASAEVFENEKTVIYDGVTGFEVVAGEDAKQIEAEADDDTTSFKEVETDDENK